MMMGFNNTMMTNSSIGWVLAVLLFVLFWTGIILLAIWLYKQFSDKKDANILGWGLILVLVVSLIFCLTMWFGWGNSVFGGWMNMGSNSQMHQMM